MQATLYLADSRSMQELSEESVDLRSKNHVEAYVYLKNKIFINRKMIQMGLAQVDKGKDFLYRKKFLEVAGGALRELGGPV